MDNRPRTRTLAAFVALFLSSCGGSPPPSTAPEPPQPLSSLVAEESAAAEPELIRQALRPWRGDYDAMVERRVIRALVPFSRTFYVLDGPTHRGLAVDAMRELERVVNEQIGDPSRRLTVLIVPVRRDQLLEHLAEGRGDIAFGNVTITPHRQQLVDFSTPHKTDAREVVVTASDAPAVASLDDLAGRPVFVRKSSSYFEHLEALNEERRRSGKTEIAVKVADEQLEDEDILELVNAGAIPATVVDQHVAEPWSKVFKNIVLAPDAVVSTDGQIAVAIRKECPKLKGVIDAFLSDHGAGTLFGNMMHAKYFEHVEALKDATSEAEIRKLDAAVDLFKKYSEQYDFDWLLVAAQAYQESGIDQSVRSPVGAVGVMQVMPSTAAGNPVNIMGVDTDMEKNIHAGVKYMRFMMDEYFEGADMTDVDRCLFAFASYNAGPARVAKLRKEAEERGLDPNKWFQNVEIIAAQRIGRETVTYVSNIYKYYVAYFFDLEHRNARGKAGKATARSRA